MDKISIIIPVYNRENTIQRCMDSIRNQTYTNLEIICVDDCSGDHSLDICRKNAETDARIKVIPLLQNGGVSHARNVGIDNASGRYIAFVDSDDTISCDMLKIMHNMAIAYDSDIVLSNLSRVENGNITNTGTGLEPNRKYDKKFIQEKVLPAFTIPGQENLVLYSFSTKLYKSEIIQDNAIKFDESISYQEDKLFVIDAFANCESIVCLDEAFYQYEIQPGGLYSNYKNSAWKDYVNLYWGFINRVRQYHIDGARIESIAEDFAYNITWFLYRTERIKIKKEKMQLQAEIIHDKDVVEVCQCIYNMLFSFDKRMIKCILSGNRFLTIAMIDFVYSGKKDKVLSFLGRK